MNNAHPPTRRRFFPCPPGMHPVYRENDPECRLYEEDYGTVFIMIYDLLKLGQGRIQYQWNTHLLPYRMEMKRTSTTFSLLDHQHREKIMI